MFGSHSITFSVPETRTYLDAITNKSYPPHNILKTKEGYCLELAVAGFKKEEIKVYTEEDNLYVEGLREDSHDETEYIYRGLAFRRFSRVWKMPNDLKVDDVTHSDGLVSVNFKKIIPEAQRRKDYL